MKNILCFDIGNTNTRLGIYKPEEIIPESIYTYRTEKKTTPGELGIIVKNFLEIYEKDINSKVEIEGMAVSSVVPGIDKQYKIMSDSLFNLGLLQINCSINLGIKIVYDKPEELGADRIANAVGAYKEYKRDAIIIDLGTANTFCVVHENGVFDGGLIGPGFGIMMEVLAEKTSKLSRVDFEKPGNIIATNTIDAIKSGFFYGSMSIINGIIANIEEEYRKEFLIILTGGFSEKISPNLDKKHILDPLLTMKGIKYLYNMNKSQLAGSVPAPRMGADAEKTE